MCRAPASSSIAATVDHPRVVIRLELHPTEDSLSGRASDGSGTAREFVGWMGLVAAIDALLPASSPALGGAAPSSPPDEGDPV
jgi:hypothetical protein